LISLGRSSYDDLSTALLNGDLEFLWNQLSSIKAELMDPLSKLKYDPYKELIKRLVAELPNKLSREELLILYKWCVGNDVPESPNKFTSMLRHNGLTLKQQWINGRNVKGIELSWHCTDEFLEQARTEIMENRL